MFILSGAVGDDPLVFFEGDVTDISFKFIQWNGDRACNVTSSKGLRAANIHNDRFAAIDSTAALASSTVMRGTSASVAGMLGFPCVEIA